MVSVLARWISQSIIVNNCLHAFISGFFILGKDAKDVFEIYENKVKGKLTKVVGSE